jgi:amino acid adenylation domain-containing protein
MNRIPISASTLLDSFYGWVEETPQAPAMIEPDRTWTYHDFAQRVNQIAAALQARGIQAGDRVGICLPRGVDLLASIFAATAVGATYVPLDPTYPANRLAMMVAEAGLAITLTAGVSAAIEPAIDLAADLGAGAGAVNTKVDADAGLYVIFTSGSTGTPKAAGVRRRGFANLLDWYVNGFDFHPAARTLILSSPSFDLTQKNFFAPLLSGGAIVLPGPGAYDPALLRATIERHRVTSINCTPSAFYPLVEASSSAAALQSLRQVFLGGEPIHAQRLRNWTASPHFAGVIVNSYGPTECSDVVAFHTLTAAELAGDATVPLGREVPGNELHVLVDGRPAATGEMGELVIGGVGVGFGYVNDAVLTSRKFQPFPNPDSPLAYWTGDLVSRRPDGLLDFHGRADHQVKVSGHRVELGEIERAIRQHADVRDCVVLAEDSRLTAFFLGEATPDSLAELCRQNLPSFMTPSTWCRLAEFPLSPNGKVDRRELARLLAPAGTTASIAEGDSAASRIQRIWCALLKRDAIGVDDNFFSSGGTSLLAASLQASIEAEFGRTVPVAAVFDHPTIRQFVQYLSVQSTDGTQGATRGGEQARAYQRWRKPAMAGQGMAR